MSRGRTPGRTPSPERRGRAQTPGRDARGAGAMARSVSPERSHLGNPVVTFSHYTSREAIFKILRSGELKASQHGSHGQGVYFTNKNRIGNKMSIIKNNYYPKLTEEQLCRGGDSDFHTMDRVDDVAYVLEIDVPRDQVSGGSLNRGTEYASQDQAFDEHFKTRADQLAHTDRNSRIRLYHDLPMYKIRHGTSDVWVWKKVLDLKEFNFRIYKVSTPKVDSDQRHLSTDRPAPPATAPEFWTRYDLLVEHRLLTQSRGGHSMAWGRDRKAEHFLFDFNLMPDLHGNKFMNVKRMQHMFNGGNPVLPAAIGVSMPRVLPAATRAMPVPASDQECVCTVQ